MAALSAWTNLQAFHQLQGPISQVNLIQEAFAICYSSSTLFAETTSKICNLNKCIWDMGNPTLDSFLIILMLLALLSPDLSNICDSVVNGISSSTPATPYTADSIVSHLDLEQSVHAANVPNEAHAACAQSKDRRSSDICSNCKNLITGLSFVSILEVEWLARLLRKLKLHNMRSEDLRTRLLQNLRRQRHLASLSSMTLRTTHTSWTHTLGLLS